jgi:AsmA protein
MKTRRKKILMFSGGFIVLMAIATMAGALFFNINDYKQWIETAVSDAAGLDVKINANMHLSFFPFGLSAKDIHVANESVEIFSLEKLKLGVAFIPLLKKQLKITRCEIYKPTIITVKDARGQYNFKHVEKKLSEMKLKTDFRLKKLSLVHGDLVHVDRKTGERTELKDINLATQDFLLKNISGDIMKKVSFVGTFDCQEIRIGNLKIHNITGPVKADQGLITLNPLTLDIFGAKGEANATANASKDHLVAELNLKVPNLDFVELQNALGVKKAIGGKGDLDASFTMEEKEALSSISSLGGHFYLQGKNLILYTMDLDQVLSAYETSQRFNLVDLGAFFIAGPLGTVGLKGYSYFDVYDQTRHGQGEIARFVSRWKIKGGIADALDCALTTQHHRVALIGHLNLARGRYENITVALVDGKGCVKFKQGITGPFGSPKIGTVSAVETLGGPIFNLYRKTKRFVQGDNCEVFYNGSLRQL